MAAAADSNKIGRVACRYLELGHASERHRALPPAGPPSAAAALGTPPVSAAGTARFRFVPFRSRGRSPAVSSCVDSRHAPLLLIRSSRIAVTWIAAMGTCTAQLMKR